MADLWNEWVFDQSTEIEESNAVQLLREQARLLSKKTEGIVKASFTKIGNVQLPEGIAAFVDNTARIISQLSKVQTEELKGKKDIGAEYDAVAYKFEIYSENYRFRVFELIDKKLFPISIICDEDIARQIGIPVQSEVLSNKMLERLIAQVLGSTKMKSVIGRMMKESMVKGTVRSVLTKEEANKLGKSE